MSTLRALVFEALTNNRDNGYWEADYFDGYTDEDVALEMIAYDDDLSDYHTCELILHITACLQENGV
jgi:hypothetical protein